MAGIIKTERKKFGEIDKEISYEGTKIALTEHPTEKVSTEWVYKKGLGFNPKAIERMPLKKEALSALEAKGIVQGSVLAVVKETEKAKLVVTIGQGYGLNPRKVDWDNPGTIEPIYEVSWIPKSGIERVDPQLEAIKSAVGSSGE